MSLLTVKNIKKETSDCVSIYFDKTEDYKFIPGQYVTVIADINGEEVRRSYSICTSTFDTELGIAVKKISKGKMSTYLNDVLKVGDQLEILPPEGSFVLRAKETAHRDHYFLSAGSGITPVISMIKEVIEKEPQSYCYLYYGSRDEEHIIFGEEIAQLEQKYKGQLMVINTLSQPIKTKGKGVLGFLKKSIHWQGETGRIDIAKFINFLELFPARANEQHYYFCGPAEMIQMGEQLLTERNIEAKFIHKEYFNVPAELVEEVDGKASKMTVSHRGETREILVKEGQTILEAMIAADTNPQYSCTSGACSSCIAKVTEGSAKMEVCFALDPDEVEDGYILTCQAKPTSSNITIEYHDEDDMGVYK